MIVYGINPVVEALKARRVTRLRISARGDKRIQEIVSLASTERVPVERVDAEALDRAARGGVHQGVVADVEAPREYTVQDLVLPPEGGSHTDKEGGSRTDKEGGSHTDKEGGGHTDKEGGGHTDDESGSRANDDLWLPPSGGRPLIVVLDGVEDPHNVGAILRTCDAAGATGVIRQERHSAALDGVVGKASAGAIAHVRIATVVNIARAVEELKDADVWTVGLDGGAPEPYTAVDWTLPTAIVLGAEGTGLRRLVRERCDRLVHIPMLGAVTSLNVSVAAGVVLYEALRQRRNGVK